MSTATHETAGSAAHTYGPPVVVEVRVTGCHSPGYAPADPGRDAQLDR